SRSSSGYFLGAAMTLILPWNESLHQTRGATPLRQAAVISRASHELHVALVLEVRAHAVGDVDVHEFVRRRCEAGETSRVLPGLRDLVDVLEDGVVGRVVPVDGFLDARGQGAP